MAGLLQLTISIFRYGGLKLHSTQRCKSLEDLREGCQPEHESLFSKFKEDKGLLKLAPMKMQLVFDTGCHRLSLNLYKYIA